MTATKRARLFAGSEVERVGRWREYEVFRRVNRRLDTGYAIPVFILVGNGSVTYATDDEALQFLYSLSEKKRLKLMPMT